MVISPLISRLRDLINRQPYHLFLPFTSVWLIKPLYQGTRSDWLALAIAWPLFAILYALAHSGKRSIWTLSLAGLSVLGAVYVPLNPEASGIFALAAAILATRLHGPRLLWGFLFSINLLLLAEVLLFRLNIWSWIGGGFGAILLALYVLLNVRDRETNLQLRLAQDEITRLAKLTERERITRDLHDVLGHTLSLIAMKSELAQKRFSVDPQATFAEAQQIEHISRQALARVREALHGYTDASFAGELDRVSSGLRSVGIEVECSIAEVALTSMQESVFAMVLQEAATNMIRHAHASRCRIEIRRAGEALELLVQDNGGGSPDYDGFGLRGMRERLRLLGGSLRVTNDHGTRLEARLPAQ